MVGLLAGAAKGLLKKPQKINPDKFAGKMEATKAAAKPKGAIVPSQQDSVSIVKVVDIKPKDPKVKAKGGPLAEIQESVHSIVVALKGEQDAKKKRAVAQRKKNQKNKRLNLILVLILTKTEIAFLTSKLSATELIGLLFGFKFLILIMDLSLTTFPFHLLGLNGLIGIIESFFESKFKIGP